jgi:hypothetical protein
MRPEAQEQVPAVQTWPVPHARPHVPQLALSVATFRHSVPHAIWPAPHVVPLGAGVAQPATNNKQPVKAAKRADTRRGLFI